MGKVIDFIFLGSSLLARIFNRKVFFIFEINLFDEVLISPPWGFDNEFLIDLDSLEKFWSFRCQENSSFPLEASDTTGWVDAEFSRQHCCSMLWNVPRLSSRRLLCFEHGKIVELKICSHLQQFWKACNCNLLSH
jgi:hypothetical protein